MTKPLTQSDPDELWRPEAKKRGLTVAEYRQQVKLADEIIEQILNEENQFFELVKRLNPNADKGKALSWFNEKAVEISGPFPSLAKLAEQYAKER